MLQNVCAELCVCVGGSVVVVKIYESPRSLLNFSVSTSETAPKNKVYQLKHSLVLFCAFINVVTGKIKIAFVADICGLLVYFYGLLRLCTTLPGA